MIISASIMTMLADFAVKAGVNLAIKLHRGPMHELAEKYRKELEAQDAQAKK